MKKTSIFLLVTLLAVLLFTVACGTTVTETTAETTQAVESTPSGTTVSTTASNTTTPITTAITPSSTTATVTTSKPVQVENPVKLLSFNLRYDITSHDLMSLDIRGAHLMELVQKYDPDSISFCEATNNWMKYLHAEMPKLGYKGVGVGRDSGSTGGSGNGNEHSPVFYKADKYDLLESDTFWISATPETASKSWDSSMKRICTYAVLKNKETGAIYAHFSAHLDHKGPESRKNAVIVIESYINAAMKKYGDIGIVLSGDFNDTVGSDMYLALSTFLDDSRSIAKEKLVVGSTTNGYRPDDWEASSSSGKTPTVGTSSPIDYIFVGKKTATVSLYTVVSDLFTFEYKGKTWHEHPVSDHYGVYCEANFTAPTANIKYDESKIVSYRATLSPSKTLPESYQNMTVINDAFTASSTLIQNKSIENILKNDSSVGSVMVTGGKHGVWEITLAADSLKEITGLSFTTGTATKKIPQTLRIYVSNDGSNWKRLGSVYTEEITSSTTYYLSAPTPKVRAQYIKLVFSDCNSSTELVNVSIYGQ